MNLVKYVLLFEFFYSISSLTFDFNFFYIEFDPQFFN